MSASQRQAEPTEVVVTRLEEQLHAMTQRVDAMSAEHRASTSELRQTIDRLTMTVAASQRTNWPVLLSAAAFALAFITVVGGVCATVVWSRVDVVESRLNGRIDQLSTRIDGGDDRRPAANRPKAVP